MDQTKTGHPNSHIQNSFNISNSYNTTIPDETPLILQWLSPLEPQKRHHDVRMGRVSGVGDWFLRTNEFVRWSNGEEGSVSGVLFCEGHPGVGKTYLNSLVIDHLCDQARGKNIVVAGLYCDFLTEKEQSPTNVLGAMLKQVIGRGEIPEFIREAFYEGKRQFGGRAPLCSELVEMLKKVLASHERAFICIDALDECLPGHRIDLLASLQEIQEVIGTQIFITGRPYVRDEVVRHLSNPDITTFSPSRDDMKIYLRMRLDKDTDPEAMNDLLRAEIMWSIPEAVTEIFLLVSLHIDAILAEATTHKRREKLNEVTNGQGLGDAYATTLERIKAQKGNKAKLGIEILMWVSCSERPLRAEELCHALGVEADSTDLNIDNVPSIRTLLSCSLGLVTVDNSSSTVRLFHFTLEEYLSEHPYLFARAHSIIAEICLTYLNFRSVTVIPSLKAISTRAPLLKYASCYWAIHARKQTSEVVKTLALKLFRQYDNHISVYILSISNSGLRRPKTVPLKGFSALHCVAFFGINGLVGTLKEMKRWNVNGRDTTGSTPLLWAASNGHSEMVRLLLQWPDVDPNLEDKQKRTPLSWAAEMGFEGVIELLLAREDINPNLVDRRGRSPRDWASVRRYERVLELLPAQQVVSHHSAAKHSRAHFSWAEVVAKLLRTRENSNPNAVHKDGQHPLLLAASSGSEEVVKLLLAREDVNPDAPDSYGRAPLWWAAYRGHEGVVKLLLAREDVNPNLPDKYGLTPLFLAAYLGHERVVKFLLDRGDVNSSSADEDGRTPLSRAASFGFEGVVKLLLAREDVNPDSPDKYGRTPLSWAAYRGHEGVVELLLARGDVNPDSVDNKGRTPLLLAASSGSEEIVKLLLAREDVNPDSSYKYGHTPLSWAAYWGREGVVKLLLARGDVNPNSVDNRGRTPLTLAADRNREGVVKMLIAQKRSSHSLVASHDQRRLSSASSNGHAEASRALAGPRDAHRTGKCCQPRISLSRCRYRTCVRGQITVRRSPTTFLLFYIYYYSSSFSLKHPSPPILSHTTITITTITQATNPALGENRRLAQVF